VNRPNRIKALTRKAEAGDFYSQFFSWFLKAAQKGDDEAQLKVGYAYHEGIGVRRDFRKAVYWYKRASRQENKYAQYNIGLCYIDGDGVGQNKRQAIKWLQRAAQQQHSGAKRVLKGIGV
jgi:TPR repeat protein